MTTDSISKRLNLPFEYYDYGVNFEGQVYISQQSAVDRLNEVLGFQNWELEPVEIKVNMDTFSVSILGKLKAYDELSDRWISRTQYGNDTMTILRNQDVPQPQAIEDAKKSAMSDCLKKCASWFGCASDIFKGRIKAIKSEKSDGTPNAIYRKLINTFKLDEFVLKNGVVILPDSYKDYYEEKGWFGVFESDLRSVLHSPGPAGSTAPTQAHTPKQQTSRAAKPQTETDEPPAIHSTAGDRNRSRSNSPSVFRIMALSAPKTNHDGTAIFDAILESKEQVAVLVPSILVSRKVINKISPNHVLIVSGWLNDKAAVLRVANHGKFEIERQKVS